MSVILTYDFEKKADRNRIQCMLERLGWEKLGGTCYRYPRLGTTQHETEDWFNHVIPALMLFRTYVVKKGAVLKQFTLDINSSSGYRSSSGPKQTSVGQLPKLAEQDDLYPIPGTNQSFSKKRLIKWINGINWPY